MATDKSGRPGKPIGARTDRSSQRSSPQRRLAPGQRVGARLGARGTGAPGGVIGGGVEGAGMAGGVRFWLLEDAVRRLLPCIRPADVLLREFFRAHPELGRRDRARIAQAAFAVLRHRRRLEHLIAGGPGPRERLLALLALCMVAGEKACSGVVARDPDLARWFSNIAPAVDDPVRAAALAPAVRNSLPDWLHERLAAQWSGDALEALESALLAPAPLDLRVNLLKADVPAAIAALAAEDIAATAIEKVPGALRLTGHPALEHSKTFLDGWVEVQDAGSQWLVACVGAKRGETIVDFCAGAGGKTLALAAAMRGGGQVFAIDVSEGRLAKLRPRLLRAGATNVQPMRIESEADPKLNRLSKRADRVLVDAPCSGTGTLRRNPDLKWRQSLRDVAELTVRQGAILAAAAQLVKPGGRLVYATCSLLEAENDGVARAFAEKHPDFMAVDADPGGAGLATGFPGARTLLPHLEGCDGFYAVAFQRLKPSTV